MLSAIFAIREINIKKWLIDKIIDNIATIRYKLVAKLLSFYAFLHLYVKEMHL